MIEFQTTLNKSKNRAFANFQFKKMIWLFLLLSLLLILCGISSLRGGEAQSDKDAGITYIVCGVLLTPFVYGILYINQQNIAKTAPFFSDETKEIYTFNEEYMTVTQIREGVFEDTLKAKYSFFYQVREDKKYFYFLVSQGQCYVIDKASITQGTIEEFKELLKTTLTIKYKPKK